MLDSFQTFFLREECGGQDYQQNHKQHNQLTLPHKFQLKNAARNSANKMTTKYNAESALHCRCYVTMSQNNIQSTYVLAALAALCLPRLPTYRLLWI